MEPAVIAATLPPLPVWRPCYEGATVRNAYAGAATAVGMNANRMAAAIVHGRTGPEAFVPDKRVFELDRVVETRSAEELEDARPDVAPARVTVHPGDGACSHRANPAGPGGPRHKFEYLVDREADEPYERLLGVEAVEDMPAIFEVAA